jgi:hypothetical protein
MNVILDEIIVSFVRSSSDKASNIIGRVFMNAISIQYYGDMFMLHVYFNPHCIC